MIKTLLGRLGRPEEAANVALFLACDDSSSVGNYEPDGDTLRICRYLVRTDQAPGEVRDRRGVGVGTRSVEAREEVTVKADPVGTPNHRLLGVVQH